MSLGVPELRHHGRSCEESYHGQCARTSWRVHGSAMDLNRWCVSICGCAERRCREKDGARCRLIAVDNRPKDVCIEM